jgi:acetolactate decarboxylase
VTDHDQIARHGLLSVPDHHLVHAARGTRAATDHVEVRRTTPTEFRAERLGDATQVVEQTSSIDALLHGAYEGDVTFEELARHGDLGIGTVQHLDGEMLALDGEFLQVRADGSVHVLDPSASTPFAVVCWFRPGAPRTLGPMSWTRLADELGSGADDRLVQAVRIDAVLDHVALRSVPKQTRPYPPLTEVVAHQTNWDAHDVHGTIVGFRFPANLQGIEVAGVHLHFVSHDRTVGGHITDLALRSGTLWLEELSELHVEVPEGVHVSAADAGADLGAAIRAVEGGTHPGGTLPG